MREILFRGKNFKNGEWVYGDFFTCTLCDGQIRQRTVGEKVVIQHGTFGQYTGLIDLHGNQIFEGDIVKARLEGGNYEGFVWPQMQVDFKNGAFCLIDSVGRLFANFNGFAPSVSFEVIGNIHDNPELLKGGD